MTDTHIQSIPDLKEGDTVVSPEGADEIVLKANLFLTTQTANGKYRVYFNGVPKDVVEDKDKALDDMAYFMGMLASLHLDPKETVKAMIDGLKRRD